MLGFDFKKISEFKRFAEEFEDLGKIGHGGFAEVHKVKHKIDGNIYALKIVEIKPSQNDDENDEHFYKMLGEVKLHSTLSHPHILSFNGCWIELDHLVQDQYVDISLQLDDQPEFQMVMLNQSFNSEDFFFANSKSNQTVKEISLKTSENTNNKLLPTQTQPKNNYPTGDKLRHYKSIKIYILSELCEENLHEYVYQRNIAKKNQKNQNDKIEWKKNYEIILQLVNGLNYLHMNRIIHRDIKLQNVMLNPEGQCKIIDFGLAKRVKTWKSSIEGHHSTENTFLDQESGDQEINSSSIGTKLFSSPEQMTSEKYDHRTDIYSLAIVIVLLFSTFTTAHQQRQLLENIRNRQLDEIALPQSLKTLLNRCLSPEHQRPNLHELKNAVSILLKEECRNMEKRKLENSSYLGIIETQSKIKNIVNDQKRSPLQEITFDSKRGFKEAIQA